MAAELDTLRKEPGDRESLHHLMRLFHGLAGSGATYGFDAVSELGREGEHQCDVCLEEKRSPVEGELSGWEELLEGIQEEVCRDDGKVVEIPAEAPGSASREYEILVVEGDRETGKILEDHLVQEGMVVCRTGTLREASEILERRMPDGLIVETSLSDGRGYDLVRRVRSLPGGDQLAVLVTSVPNTFLDKVEAIHSGADGFFEKPLDWNALLRRLASLLDRLHVGPPRILSVEDDPSQADYIRTVLESAGYLVHVCDEPAGFEHELSHFKPDLVLMDVVLPLVTGYDLVRFLRQNEQYATLPVIFLTTKDQVSDRMEAARVGGDEHLVKPVAPGLLLSHVASRVERFRQLKRMLDRDGLTQLLTHTAFMERARALVDQALRRPERSITMAMVDLDHFKQINDRFGHPTGDRVLMTLAALLRRRLRSTDTIGRYGGEEFGLIFEDLDEEATVQLLERLRQEFSEIEHHAAGGEAFRNTFSAGVARLEGDSPQLDAWRGSADGALYCAKARGRNLVVGASEPTCDTEDTGT